MRHFSLIVHDSQDLQSELTSADSSTSRKRKRPKQIVESYHAGLPASRRRTIQNQFMSGALRIVVATIAFGKFYPLSGATIYKGNGQF